MNEMHPVRWKLEPGGKQGQVGEWSRHRKFEKGTQSIGLYVTTDGEELEDRHS